MPATTAAAAKVFIADSFGVALAGSRVSHLNALHDLTRGWGSGDAARVWTTGHRVPAGAAAFLNSYQIHNQEWDCLHERAVVHPMAVVLATLVAWGESRPVATPMTGRDLLTACAVAVDVAVGLGLCARETLQFFRPAMCGALGATAGIASVRRYDARQVRAAVGSCYSQLSGTMQAHVEGSPLLPLQIGFNARAALDAIALTERGILGPQAAIEGPYGFFALFERQADLAPLRALGATSRLTELSHKPFPSGRATHGGVDGLLTLAAAHRFTADDVRAARVFAPPLVRQLVDRPTRPAMDAAYARLCLPYVAATAMLQGGVGVEDFDETALCNARRLELASRVRVMPNDSADRNALVPQRVEVDLADGRHVAIDLPAVLGAPQRPLSSHQHLAKFHRAADSATIPLPTAQRRALLACIDDLEHLTDVRHLADLLIAN